MATTQTFSIADDLPNGDPASNVRCLIAAGYANALWVDDTGVINGVPRTTLSFQVDADGVAHSVMKAAINNNFPPYSGALSLDVPSPIVVTGDGVATQVVIVSDPRGALAEGKTVKLLIPRGVYVPVSGDQFVIDAWGNASITFGPCNGCVGDLRLRLYYENEEIDGLDFYLRFGSV